MAHINIDERQAHVSELIKSGYIGKDLRNAAVIFNCTISTIYSDLITLKKEYNYTVRPSPRTKKTVLERDNYTCQYCDTKTGCLVVDHIVPASKGGVGYIYNLVTACQSCNIRKKNCSWIPKDHLYFKQLNPDWFEKIVKMAILPKRLVLPQSQATTHLHA